MIREIKELTCDHCKKKVELHESSVYFQLNLAGNIFDSEPSIELTTHVDQSRF